MISGGEIDNGFTVAKRNPPAVGQHDPKRKTPFGPCAAGLSSLALNGPSRAIQHFYSTTNLYADQSILGRSDRPAAVSPARSNVAFSQHG